MEAKNKPILEFLKKNPNSTSKEIFDLLPYSQSYATLKRTLSILIEDKLVIREAKKYRLSPFYRLIEPIDMDDYFKSEVDERIIINSFNFELINGVLNEVDLFTSSELQYLSALQDKFKKNISRLSDDGYKNEMERLAVDLSWKSSQIEGNTYSLLETERLLKEKQTASGKSKDDAIMLLNHKEALDFILANPDYLSNLTVSRIEDIHSILTKELGVKRNIRIDRVGITGTNYKPLDNDFQIKEALRDTCNLVNIKTNVFEKAFLVLVLISYIQPFGDGNKRTARIVSNAILLANGYCPLSFRTVDSIDYKKAMLIFYEQNNITAFKKIFIEQFEFAVNTYF